MTSPDPILSANLYASGRLDAVVFRLVAPVWRRIREETPGDDPAGAGHLWLMRYARGGEHLKLRLYGTETVARAFRRRLEAAAGGFFSALDASAAEGTDAAEAPRFSRPDAPPLDAQDEAPDGHPDRSLLWTDYRRSALCLGGRPWLDDESYVRLLTRCLAAATELLLEAEPPGDALPHRLRQSTLLKGLILGLEALGWSRETRSAYLAYHRDWLLREPILRGAADEAALVETQRRYDEQAGHVATYVNALRTVLEEEWFASAPEENPVHAAWKRSLADLADEVRGHREDPDRLLDPFAPDLLFIPVFKVMHGLANQVGLSRVDEAFAHHLLLRAAQPEGTGDRIQLLPDGDTGASAAPVEGRAP